MASTARRLRSHAFVLLAVCVAVTSIAACSSSGGSRTQRSRCALPSAVRATDARIVPGRPDDRTIVSFDGARIRVHWFPLRRAAGGPPVPTVLVAPGWAMPGDTGARGVGAFGELSIPSLHAAGYNVATWDPRGFGLSTGVSELDSVDFEARDVARIIDWIATQPGVQLDERGDPRIGMAGHSYGGAIQLVTAAIDCRVDAIVPALTWNSLAAGFSRAGLAKPGWIALLDDASADERVDTHLANARVAAERDGELPAPIREWLESRGPGSLIGAVRAPTLLIQGTVDTFFPISEAVATYRVLQANGVRTRMLWYCGGHGVCLTKRGADNRSQRATLAWFDRYLKERADAAVGPPLEVVDQDGRSHAIDRLPTGAGAGALTGRGRGNLALDPEGGSGKVTPTARGTLPAVAVETKPTPARRAVNVDIERAGTPELVVGAPELRMTYRGNASAGDRPTHVFAQIVDRVTGHVVGNQVTPIPVDLDGRLHRITVPLEYVVFAATPASRLTLQLVAASAGFAHPRFGGRVELTSIEVSLPSDPAA
jgi:ABC-2 type transport system ATP-binding protein